jgi:lysophospholipase L1-like esterase
MSAKRFMALFLAACLSSGLAGAESRSETVRRKVTIVAFGDSITAAKRQSLEARWTEIVRKELERHFPHCTIQLVNAGVGGNTSREGLRRIEKDVLAHRPDFVLVEFGNDATPVPERHVTFEEFTANLNRINQAVLERSKARMILLTFPPMIDRWHAKYNDPFYQQNGGQDAYQERYRELTRQFALEHGLPLVDVARALREAISREDPKEYILPDGVHLTDRANALVGQLVLQTLRGEIERFLASARKP